MSYDELVEMNEKLTKELTEVKEKLVNLEVELHEEYERSLKSLKEYMVGKIGLYLKKAMSTEEGIKNIMAKSALEIYDAAKANDLANKREGN